jgi:hypothetical protein
MENLQNILNEVKRYYLLPVDLNPTASEINRATEGIPEWISTPAKVFLENIEAAITTAKIPYTIARTSILTARFNTLTIRHRILFDADTRTSLPSDEDIEKTPKEQAELDEIVRKKALVEFLEEQKNLAARSQIENQWAAFLIAQLQDKEMETAAKELLRQAVVMIWGAFEVLCRDIFVGHLNSNPAEWQKLTADSDTKKIFQVKGIVFEELSEYGFDVSKNLGNVFVNAHDFSSLGAIKQTFKVLFPASNELLDQLGDHKFWILHQRRHLIVHRRAVVDKQYLEKTGEKIKIGEQMTPTPPEIEEYIQLVCRAALALVKAATKK